MNALRLLFLLVGSALTTNAQTPTDSLLSPFDTVGIRQQRVLFTKVSTYSYHAATQLSGLQLMPILLRSPDSTVHRLALRSKRLKTATLPLILSSYGLVLLAVRASVVHRNAGLGSVMALGGLGTLVTGDVLGLSAPGIMNRAVRRYNQRISYDENAYAMPALWVSGTDFELTQADTINIRKQGIGYRYMYRGIQVAPELQLATAMKSVKDPFVNEGLRQNRVVSGVNGLIGGLSAGYATVYFLTRFIAQAAGLRVQPVNSLVYVALGGLAVTFTIGRLTDRTTRQVVRRYNERLRTDESSVVK